MFYSRSFKYYSKLMIGKCHTFDRIPLENNFNLKKQHFHREKSSIFFLFLGNIYIYIYTKNKAVNIKYFNQKDNYF